MATALDLIAGPNWYAGPAFELGGTLVDNVVGDGAHEFVFMSQGKLGYAAPAGTPDAAWSFQVTSRA